MRRCLTKLCAILLLVSYGRAEEVTVQENVRYDYVSVSFSQNVQAEKGKELLGNLTESLKEASDVLSKAIELPFRKVTVQIPLSWDTSEWGIETKITASTKNHLKSDFVIDGATDVVFGKLPHAHQYGGCGVPGHQVVIPTDFFSEGNPFPKGTALAREWLKYRYGVFDENGYLNDPLYPLYYVVPGDDLNEVKVTDCTDLPVTYDFVDKSNGGNCTQSETTVFENLNANLCDIVPLSETIEDVTSSIMFYHKDIDAMQHICNEANHNSLSPNKQNTLCSRQSIWEVVEKSLAKSKNIENSGEIDFIYVQQAKPKLVVAWEDTSLLKIKKPVILNAVKQLVIDLPMGSQFAGFHFNDILAQESDGVLQELTGLTEKAAVVTKISSDFVKNVDVVNINIAIEEALRILSAAAGDAKTEGTIIVITKTNGTLDEKLVEALKDTDVCIKLMFLSNNDIPDDWSTAFEGLPCATWKKVPLETDEETFGELYSGMRSFLPSITDDQEKNMVKIGYLTEETSLGVEVDNSAESVTFFVYKNRQTENFRLTLNGGQVQTSEIFTLGIGDVKILFFVVPEAGTIEFAYPHEDDPILTQIQVASKPGKYFTGEVLVHDTTEENSTQMPVIIYALVRYGAYPVQNANVSATVQGPDGNSTTLDLYDNGRGDPDITRNDGIYSRYFIQFSGEGVYTVTVTVKNNENSASYGVVEHADIPVSDYKPCCGSSVDGETPKIEGEISKEFVTTFTANSGPPEDGYPPSRIFDLRVDGITDDKLTLKWTAPGAQADHGAASSYDIKLFCTDGNATDCNVLKMVRVLNKPPPLKYSTEQEMTIEILTKTHTLSMGIIAINENKISSETSNVIQIFTAADELAEVTTAVHEDIATRELRSPGAIVGVGILSVLAVICLLTIIIFYIKRKSKRTARKPDVDQIEENVNEREVRHIDLSMNIAPLQKTESFPVILYTHDQIKDRKEKDKSPPLYNSNIPPKAWASLDAIQNARAEQVPRDTKSLGSRSTTDAADESESKENNDSRY